MTKPAWKKYPDWLRKEDRDAWASLTPEQRTHADTPGRRTMYEDGIPLALIAVTAQERHDSWVNNPPKPAPAFIDQPREEDPQTTAFRAELEAKAAVAAQASKREPRTKRAPRPSRDGMITVAALAQEYDLIPRLARAALRAAKVPKPPQGWAFAPGSELEATIRAALASAKAPRSPKGARKSKDVTNISMAELTGDDLRDATWSGSKKDRKRWEKQQTSSSDKADASSNSKPPSKRQSKPSKIKKHMAKQPAKSRKTSAKR